MFKFDFQLEEDDSVTDIPHDTPGRAVASTSAIPQAETAVLPCHHTTLDELVSSNVAKPSSAMATHPCQVALVSAFDDLLHPPLSSIPHSLASSPQTRPVRRAISAHQCRTR
ncbi:hypothetical protein P7C73_g6867, partial [Tremellales sp. Uapishka_1]